MEKLTIYAVCAGEWLLCLLLCVAIAEIIYQARKEYQRELLKSRRASSGCPRPHHLIQSADDRAHLYQMFRLRWAAMGGSGLGMVFNASNKEDIR